MDFRGLSFILLLVCLHGLYCQADGAANPQDVAALMALQQAWGPNKLPWKGDPCDSHWLGVSCDSATKTRIESLILPSMLLDGELPVDIGGLTYLQTLDLSFNGNLSGGLPSQLGNLGGLTTLILQSCNFSGPIPLEIGKLRNLTFLALNGNSLSGSIPGELGFLKELYWLDLAFNNLWGPLPVSTGNKLNVGLDNLTNANHFHLNHNSFSGSIPPEIFNGNMSLLHLLLDSNNLTGEIPVEVGLLPHLTILKLDHNQLSGVIPPIISQLGDTLNVMQLNHNAFIGPLPNLANFSKLQVLDLSNNNFESTEVPSWFSALTSLTSLTMEKGDLTGQISSNFFALSQLQTVKLDNNFINGTLGLENAGQQLQLVSMKYNNITNIYFGGFKNTLLLQANPICDNNNNLPDRVCSLSDSSATTSTFLYVNPCSLQCSSGLVPRPTPCSCASPFNGYFLFRAPQFTNINITQIKTLALAVAGALQLSKDQVQITNASFNSFGYLIISASIFPSNADRWSQSDIQRISAILGNDNIMGKHYPPGFGPPLFIAYRYDYVVNTSGGGLSMGAKIGIIVGAVSLVLVILVVCIYAFLQKRRADKALQSSTPFASWGASGKESGGAPQLKGARWFSHAELKKASNNFSKSNEIGAGGYGKVYKGFLPSGEQVAIKRAEGGSMQGATEFKNEIELLSRVHHKNLVNLIGFCFEQGQQMLVYEYMINGTLRDNLLGRNGVTLDWRRRLMIALGSARGIAYLHELADPPIIHRDIKSSNILLDERKIAKVADFGLSKVGPDEGAGKDHVSTQVKGTLGYLDPEYYMTQQLTEKSDVYSFGVVLLELLTARQPIERGKYIVREITTALDKGGMPALQSLLDPALNDYSLQELMKFLDLALRCVNEVASNRPTMNEVAKELEGLVGHDYPDSGSVHVDAVKSPKDPYAGDSELVQQKKSDPSFEYSGGFVAPRIEPK